MADHRPVRRAVSWLRTARVSRSPGPTNSVGDERLEHGQQGRKLLETGDYAAGEHHLAEALRESPRGPMATYLLGLSLLYQDRWDDGRQLVERAYSLRHWLDDRIVAPSAVEMLHRGQTELPDWDWPRYQLARHRWRAVGLDVQAAVQHLARVLPGRCPRFVQIGANDGRSSDPLDGLVETLGMRGTFVEPQPGPMASLRELYFDTEGLNFAEVAITEEDGPVELVTDPERSTLGSLAPERNKLRNRSSAAQQLTVEGLTFSSLAAHYQIGQFDLLQIDTEGFDYRILRQVPVDDHGVSVINLEYNCLPIGERLAAIELLVDHGFALSFSTMDLLAVRGNDFETAFCIVDRDSDGDP